MLPDVCCSVLEATPLPFTSPDSEFDPDDEDEDEDEAGYEDEDEDQGEERECVLRARPPPNFTPPSVGQSSAAGNELGKVGRSRGGGGASCNVCACHETQYTSHSWQAVWLTSGHSDFLLRKKVERKQQLASERYQHLKSEPEGERASIFAMQRCINFFIFFSLSLFFFFLPNSTSTSLPSSPPFLFSFYLLAKRQ